MRAGATLRRRARWAGVGLVLIVVGAGCGSDDTDFSGPWSDEFEWAYAAATNDFERDVLADGVVSRLEYDEAASRLLDCLNAAAATAATIPTPYGGYNYEVRGGSTSAMAECTPGTTQLIEPLYVDVLRNPDNIDLAGALVACLRREGLVGPEFTAADLAKASQDPTVSPPPTTQRRGFGSAWWIRSVW